MYGNYFGFDSDGNERFSDAKSSETKPEYEDVQVDELLVFDELMDTIANATLTNDTSVDVTELPTVSQTLSSADPTVPETLATGPNLQGEVIEVEGG